MLAQQLVNGVLLGGTYALFALGFTLTFGVLRVVNLTYGVYVSAGALAALGLTGGWGWPITAALPAAALATGAVAVFVDALLLTRLRRRGAPELASLMVTLGAALALYASMTVLLGTDIRRFPPGLLGRGAILLGPVRMTVAQGLILLTAGVLVSALFLLLARTRFGLAVRAMAEKPEVAALMGIDTARVAAGVSALSGTIAGVAGVLIGLSVNAVQPYMGEAMMLRGFVVVIAGGLGDVRGALVAGLLLGVVGVLAAGYLASGLKETAAFLILVLVLWTRPDGLFGRAAIRRA